MRILEKPIATAGLGVACAIALLFLLSSAGPFLSNHSQVPGSDNTSGSSQQNAVTSTVSSTTVAVAPSNPNSYYVNGTPSQSVTETTTMVASSATTLISVNASPLFAFAPNTLASSGHQTTTLDILAILAAISLFVALGSMFFVRRRSSKSREIDV